MFGLFQKPQPKLVSPSLPHEEIISELKKWLGHEGVDFFKQLQQRYGTLHAILDDGSDAETGYVHLVHYREGMQVRNKLRELTHYSWTDQEYDDRWSGLVEEAIKGDLHVEK